jgi:WD40 repeat protein
MLGRLDSAGMNGLDVLATTIRGFQAVIFLASALLATGSALAQQQSTLPSVLRIETGMHTAAIRAAGADAQGQMLATASDDKTVRLWSLLTGELVRVLRPQIGAGAEGELKAVALSPDGRFVVTGGWTGFEWEKANSLYVFETDTGRLVQRVRGLPEIITELAWSPDGRHVVAGLGGANGIRAFDTGDWHEVLADPNYAGPVYGLSFDASGRLAVTAFDGGIRLYDAEFRVAAPVKAPGGARPYSVAFSPNGTMLAVGYHDTLNVDILSVPELRRITAVNTSGLLGGSLSRVAWARDGALLAGGGYWSAATGSPIFRWSDNHRTKRETIAAADGTVMGIVPLADGGFVYATADPTIGRYDAQLRRVLHRRSVIADFRGQLEHLRLSMDGARVAFGLEKGGGKPARFEADARRLVTGNPPGYLRSAEVKSLPVRAWQNDIAPSLSGKALALQKSEISRSLAIAPDRQSFVLGTDWYLRRFDRSGRVIWANPVPYPAWAVNVSSDGRLAVAALADGTIRWYRYEDGWPLLALFMHRDGRRWVLWTPGGYYDASAGGEDLIGWHVNRGLDSAADYFPASRLRDRYYRPESVGAVLRTIDSQRVQPDTGAPATPPAAPVLPPVVRILSPRMGEEVGHSPVEIRYSVRSPSGERVTGVDVLMDGRPLPDLRAAEGLDTGTGSPNEEHEASVAVPLAKDATISLIARAGDRASEEATVKLIWQGIAEVDLQKPSLYLLAIGVGRYQDPDIPMLDFASADASDVAAAFKAQEGETYSKVVQSVLLDEEATLHNVQEGLDLIARDTTAHDVALVFIAGHGTNKPGKYYFLPVDAVLNRLQQTAEAQDAIRKSLARIRGTALFFFDTCNSGSVMTGARLTQPDINGVVNDLASAENGIVVFAASEGRENSAEGKSWGHGAFTKALLEALSGQAEFFRSRREITVAGLELWLGERVKELTGDQQHPTSVKPNAIRDITIARLRQLPQ